MPLLKQDDHETVVDTYFRYARIDAIDAGQDSADITLLDGQGAPTSAVWLDVPIYYHCTPDDVMRANGAIQGAAAAFAKGDEVVARFENGSPLIMGLKDELRSCLDLMFFHDPVVCYDAQGQAVDCGSQDAVESERVYTVRRVSDWAEIGTPQNLGLADKDQCTTGRQDSKHGSTLCKWQGSKTLGNATIHAFMWTPPGDRQWTVAAEVSGRMIALEDKPTFNDYLPASKIDALDIRQGYKAIDIFQEGGDTFAVAVGDEEETAYIFNVSQGGILDAKVSLGIRAWFLDQYPNHDEAYARAHVILLGVRGRKAWYADANIHYNSMMSFGEVFEIDLAAGSITTLGLSGTWIVWNEFTEQFEYFVYESNCSEDTWNHCYGAQIVKCERHKAGVGGGTPCENPLIDCGICWYTSCENDFCLPYKYEQDYEQWTYVWWEFWRLGSGTRCDHDLAGSFWSDTEVTKHTELLRAFESDGECSSTYHDGYGSGSDGSCNYWENWPLSINLSEGSVTPAGTGIKGTIAVRNGYDCDEESSLETDYEDTTVEHTDGTFQDEFAVTGWPHYRNYAILKQAKDRQQNLYTNIFAVKGDAGIDVDGQLLQGSHFFFVR